jgi:hypothetical protein
MKLLLVIVEGQLYFYWVIRWYVPRLNAASAEVARRHELVADRVAAIEIQASLSTRSTARTCLVQSSSRSPKCRRPRGVTR